MPDMLNPKLTASWEKGLDMVAKKEIPPDEFMQKLEKYIKTKFEKFMYRQIKVKKIGKNIAIGGILWQ